MDRGVGDGLLGRRSAFSGHFAGRPRVPTPSSPPPGQFHPRPLGMGMGVSGGHAGPEFSLGRAAHQRVGDVIYWRQLLLQMLLLCARR